jgi:hypothetical protein
VRPDREQPGQGRAAAGVGGLERQPHSAHAPGRRAQTFQGSRGPRSEGWEPGQVHTTGSEEEGPDLSRARRALGKDLGPGGAAAYPPPPPPAAPRPPRHAGRGRGRLGVTRPPRGALQPPPQLPGATWTPPASAHAAADRSPARPPGKVTGARAARPNRLPSPGCGSPAPGSRSLPVPGFLALGFSGWAGAVRRAVLKRPRGPSLGPGFLSSLRLAPAEAAGGTGYLARPQSRGCGGRGRTGRLGPCRPLCGWPCGPLPPGSQGRSLEENRLCGKGVPAHQRFLGGRSLPRHPSLVCSWSPPSAEGSL